MSHGVQPLAGLLTPLQSSSALAVPAAADLGDRAQYNKSRRSQYQANLCMKINAKLGGVNTKWAVRVGELLRGYFGLQHAAQVRLCYIWWLLTYLNGLDETICDHVAQQLQLRGSHTLHSGSLSTALVESAVTQLISHRYHRPVIWTNTTPCSVTYCTCCVPPQAPTLMVFGIDLTHPGRIEGGRSIAAVVGSLDRELCRYGWMGACVCVQAGETATQHLLQLLTLHSILHYIYMYW